MKQADISIYVYEIVHKYEGIWGCGQPKNHYLRSVAICDAKGNM